MPFDGYLSDSSKKSLQLHFATELHKQLSQLQNEKDCKKKSHSQEKRVQRTTKDSVHYVDFIEDDMNVSDDDDFEPIHSKKGKKK
jgi:hypothetical protein